MTTSNTSNTTITVLQDLHTTKIEMGEIQEKCNAIELSWSHLTAKTEDGSKTLLNNISGKVKSRFLAIMGPSGSGKSTLMNILARRAYGIKVEGAMNINGAPYNATELKAVSGYVMQDDLLNGNLTVQETLDYSALLRLPKSMPKEDKQKRVESAIAKVGLGHVRNVIIGDSIKKGISGGEKRRVSVAMELITNPRLLFLDEPTSGLDSVTALHLTRLLKSLTEAGECTVVCTIHQPQSKIFDLFDDLLLLNTGNLVYFGESHKAVDFFAKNGFPCPPLTNPADHFLDVITPSETEESMSVMSYQKPVEVDANLVKDEKAINRLELYLRDKPSWLQQFRVLLRRSFYASLRDWNVSLTLIIQVVLMAFLIGGAFWNIGNAASSAERRQPALFFCVINQGVFAALTVVNSFPSERLLVLRERASGSYHVSAYFLAKNVIDAFIQLPGPIIFSCIVYWMVGFQPLFDKFLIFTGFMILCNFASISLALMISALAKTTTLSVTILPMLLEVCRLFGGFFLSPAKIPKYFTWLDAVSYVKYVYVGVSLNELQGLVLECTPDQLTADGVCIVRSGDATIKHLGMSNYTMAGQAGVLVLLIIIFRVIAYLGIRYLKH